MVEQDFKRLALRLALALADLRDTQEPGNQYRRANIDNVLFDAFKAGLIDKTTWQGHD